MEQLTLSHSTSATGKIKNIKASIALACLLWLSSASMEAQSSEQTLLTTTKEISYDYEMKEQELRLNIPYHMNIVKNNDGTYSISSNIEDIQIDSTILQDYCNHNGLEDVIVTEDNKQDVLEAINAMIFKDELLNKWQEDLGVYVFNTLNKSNTLNILNACGKAN